MLSETESLKHLIPFIVQESGDHWNLHDDSVLFGRADPS